MLEKNLRDAAAFAANDKGRQSTRADPEELLAQIGELRRALEEARREGRGRAASEDVAAEQLASADEHQGEAGDASAEDRDPSAQPERNQPGRSAREGSPDDMRTALPTGGGGPNGLGLRAWDPAINGWHAPDLSPERMRDAHEVSERVQRLADRMRRGPMSESELRALQRMAHELRSLTGNPLAARPEAMAKLVDQLELATLAAAQKANSGAPPRTAVQSDDDTSYREAVAEYYRRLGGS